jgi:polysaccharide biosynthesis protein PslH
MAQARLSVLAVSSELPWPLDSGGHLRTFHLLRSIAQRFDVRLVVPWAPRLDAGVAALRQAGIAVRVAGASRPRAFQRGFGVLQAAALGQPYVMYRKHAHAAVKAALRAECQARPPDVCYLDHLDSFVYAADLPPASIAGDLHNVYSLLAARTAVEHANPIVRQYLRREARLLANAERHAARTANLLMAVSQPEQRYFEELLPDGPSVEVVPNGVDCARYLALPAGRMSGRPLIIYIGAVSWRPNAAAACFLARDVMPALQSIVPGARLRIVGRDPLPEVMALKANPAIEVTGAVPDVLPHLEEAHVLAVPLESGGGTRLKILEAFAAGLPVVSTPVGCEGIAAVSGRHLIVAPRARFVAAIAGVLLNPDHAATLACDARALVRERYDWRTIGASAVRAILETHEGRSCRRRSRTITCRADRPLSGALG